jgi:hypothetical protein
MFIRNGFTFSGTLTEKRISGIIPETIQIRIFLYETGNKTIHNE